MKLGLWFGKSVKVLTETNSKYCEEIDVTGIKAEEILCASCYFLFPIQRGRLLEFQRQSQSKHKY